MARTKGSKQSRNPSKYTLPSDITLVSPIQDYNKETVLEFHDPAYGPFKSSYKALQSANASTHPLAVQARREATNVLKYGVNNPSKDVTVRLKAQNTMKSRYGVEHALQSTDFLDKSMNTLKTNYGVSHPMQSTKLKQRQQDSTIKSLGVDNPMKSQLVKDKIKATCLDKYGVENPSQHPSVKEKLLKTLTENDAYQSSGELELKLYIESLGVECKTGYFGGANPKQVDIKINSLNIAIEYNGAYWHSEANKLIHKNYHLEKTEVAESQGYRLIQIMDYEWLTRQKQVKSYLRSALGKNSRRVYARKTELREVPKIVAKQMLEDYHILGAVNFITAHGLYLGDELLALVTIGRHHRKANELVLNRYVGKEDVTVIGGLSKLSKHIKGLYGSVSTWVDRRISNGSNWELCGWTKVSTLSPDYCYYNTNKRTIVSKQSRKKSAVNTPDNMTEHQHALIDGLYRIYDCGKTKLYI